MSYRVPIKLFPALFYLKYLANLSNNVYGMTPCSPASPTTRPRTFKIHLSSINNTNPKSNHFIVKKLQSTLEPETWGQIHALAGVLPSLYSIRCPSKPHTGVSPLCFARNSAILSFESSKLSSLAVLISFQTSQFWTSTTGI